MLTIENLYFSYTGSAPWLLENVDFHLAGGEYISIVGNNGSGKSTLLKIILGFLKPVSGTVTRRARRIGYVPQRSASDASFPITVEEVIHSYGKLLHLKKIDVDQVLSVTGMEGYKKQLMGSPDLLILDEPSTGVDLTSQRDIYKELDTLHKDKGVTILAVEHNLAEAGKVSDRLYHVEHGHGHLCSVRHYIEEYIEKEGGHV